jgi:UPF0755 protein
MVDTRRDDEVDGEWDEWGAPAADPDEYDEDDFAHVPRETSLGRKLLLVGAAVAMLLLVVFVVAGLWLSRQIDPPGEPGEEILVTVDEGATTGDVAKLLEEEGIIRNGFVFRLYVRAKGAGPFQAGQYDGLAINSSMGDVVTRLDEGPLPPAFSNVTVPEGLVLTELRAKLLDELPFDPAELDAAFAGASSRFMEPGTTSLEGFLFPDTYRIEEGDEANEQLLVDQMVQSFDEVATELGYDSTDPALNPTGRSPYELLTIASIIEREARVTEDQAKISRVIHNRLEQDMKLEVDATLLYGIGHKEELTESDLETDTPYNTRLYEGLPPTPIAMPGRGALEAAIRPAEGDWLFYVLADTEGHHFFTSDYDEFVNQKNKSQEEGVF